MSAARFEFTRHAIGRFVERHAPSLSFDEAKDRLVELAVFAESVTGRVREGCALWQIANPPMRLVIKEDDGTLVCVTILPAQASFGDDFAGDLSADEVVDAYERAKARFVPRPPKPIDKQRGVPAMPSGAGLLTIGQQQALRGQLADIMLQLLREQKINRQISTEIAALRKRLKGNQAHLETVVANGAKKVPEKTLKKQQAHGKLMEEEKRFYSRVVRFLLPYVIERRDDPEISQLLLDLRERNTGMLNPDAFLRSWEWRKT